ncbi:S8 family peptidase [Umezawaea endophytica]|uniref:S8 family peptidase n=1 Tax=Umezawaea endophytica TaxID=1654476 RepID=A0A9X2VGZ0_9PSEU|nr:S8 family peptidase [Umezawaea endophytica]MCS7476292.1 S8 family peptidase [Umezawaea endophytica]
MTLLTGDQVFPGSKGSAGYLKPGPGREGMRFSTFETEGHSYVVPADAEPLLAKGVLDQRLFDVTELIDSGYGDERRDTVPLIVTYRSGQRPFAATAGTTVTLDLPSVGGVAVDAEKSADSGLWTGLTGVGALASSGIEKVWLDGVRTASLDHSVPQIGAPAAWQAGYTGEGVTVAVLDTGVDQTHPDLADREVAERNFSASKDAVDHYGHGTHVASIIAGTGVKAGGKYKGVAHGARILDVKVLNDSGSGADSGIIAGMQWAAEQGAAVANMSLGGYDSPGVDPLEEAVNTLSTKYGTLFVIAAGNSGPGASTIGSPGTADEALTVGAVDRDNAIADFSSRGPVVGGGVIKPDITAPGVDIVAARHADGRIGAPVVDGYTALSGTSMATPHVAGAAALLAQQYPEATREQLKARLIASAAPTAGLTPFEQGAGRVDSARAMSQSITSLPNSVAFGAHQWPHTGEPLITKEVSYSNDGAVPLTLDLRVDTTAPGGAPAPAGLFAVVPAQLTVPAGGTATVTVTADVGKAPAGGQFGGALVATSGSVSARTAVVVDLEPESYELVVNGIQRSGEKAAYYSAFMTDVKTGELLFLDKDADGTLRRRVPIGQYLLSGSVQGSGAEYTHDSFSYPNLTVSGPTTIDLDARLAKPIVVTLPDPTARLSLLETGFQRVYGSRTYQIGGFSFGGSVSHVGLAHLGPEAPANEVVGKLSTSWVAKEGAEFYGLAWYLRGRTHTGLTKVIRKEDLATVKVDVGAPQPGESVTIGNVSTVHGQGKWGWGAIESFAAPGVRTEFYGGENADWARRLNVQSPQGYRGGLDGPPKSYVPRKSYEESFYHAVFGPSLTDNRDWPWLYRNDSELVANLPLFGDGAGNAGHATTTGTMKVYRDGELLAENTSPGYGRFALPDGAANYRLTTEATRSTSPFSTRVSAAWTFKSDRTTKVTALPISVIRYTPKLDAAGTAPAGRVFQVPVAVQNQAGAAQARKRITSAEVSYDSGATWRSVAVNGGCVLRLSHPKDAKSVSLRAKAGDRSGNTVEQTIIDAYLLR